MPSILIMLQQRFLFITEKKLLLCPTEWEKGKDTYFKYCFGPVLVIWKHWTGLMKFVSEPEQSYEKWKGYESA